MKTKQSLIFLTVSLCLSIGTLSCQKSVQPNPNGDELVQPTPEVEKEEPETYCEAPAKSIQELFHTGMTSFAVNIFKEVASGEDGKSFLISPLSLSMALAMTEGGAKGVTAEEMKAVLGFKDSSQEDMAQYFNWLTGELKNRGENTCVNIANSIWTDISFPVLDSFQTFSEKYYCAPVRSLDFKLQSTADTINKWCNDNTNGKIPEITSKDQLKDFFMALLNALYFKSPWGIEFNETNVMKEFYNINGSTKEVEMLNSIGDNFLYCQDEECTLLGIPFEDGAFMLDIIMPDKTMTLNDAISNLSDEKLLKLKRNAHSGRMLDVKFPKFKLDYCADKLVDNLKALGIEQAFSDFADFSGISQISSCIGEVMQKAYIDVNEKGCEAAAVTAVFMKATSIGEPEIEDPIPVTIDRPFLFCIRDRITDTILFMGCITNLN